ncbi:response regulator [Nibrella saemangeumensis]|uniref:Response regulator n=1 Tax=Nibrella saemangeumensis TaxID=1084526 RepID=A0ABP8NRZ1_9BACT
MENKNPLVLVADDDEDDRFFLQLAFRDSYPDCKVEFASDGVEFLDHLNHQTDKPDLVLLDINMPRMDGWEVLKAMRGNTAYQDIPIVIYSTSDDEFDKALARRLKADMYITKPSAINELQDLVLLFRREWLETGPVTL